MAFLVLARLARKISSFRESAPGKSASMSQFASAVELAEALCAEYPHDEALQMTLANVLLNWAGARQFDSIDEAEVSIRKAAKMLRRLHEDRPDNLHRCTEYAIALDDLGYLAHLSKRYDEALPSMSSPRANPTYRARRPYDAIDIYRHQSQ